MAFINYRLPIEVERGAKGGPKFNTTIATLFSGYEKRNVNWLKTRGEWDISYGLMDLFSYQDESFVSLIREVQSLFYVAQGRAHSFRFRDWADYEIGRPNTYQSIGLGDGVKTQFQMVKHYVVGSNAYDRVVTKTDSSTLKVSVNGTPITTGFTLNDLTGILTFSLAPASAANIAVYCEYDVPVRFDDDLLELDIEVFNAGKISSIKLIEVRDE